MSIKINRLEEGHNLYLSVCRRPAETVSLQRRQICYRWGTPAYWSLVPRSSMFYLFKFCLKNMWNCSLAHQILSHRFYDWKLYEMFLLSGFLIFHAVGWYMELKNISQYFSCLSFTADIIYARWTDNSFVEQVDDPAMYLSLYGVLWSLDIQYK